VRIAPKTPKDETPSETPAPAEAPAAEKGGKKEKTAKG
jgi:hypothetical protein